MKTYTREELEEICKKHIDWMNDKENGSCANLADADLMGANLRYAKGYAVAVPLSSLTFFYTPPAWM